VPPTAKLKVVYHLNNFEKVSFVVGNIQNHLESAKIKAGGTTRFRDRTDGNGVIVPDSALPSGRRPNHMLTFRSRARKLPET
jgi:hypothetical protein